MYAMRKMRFASAADLLAIDKARRAAGPPTRPSSASAAARPASARASCAPSAAGAASETGAARPGTARPSTARPSTARVGVTRSTSAAAAPRTRSSAGAAAGASGGGGGGGAGEYGDVSLGKPSADVGVLRRRLLEKIVDRRLFRESELRPFLLAVVRGNRHLDAAVLKEAVRDVEREFFLV